MADKIERFLRSSTGSAIAAKLGLEVPDLKRFEGGSGLPSGIVALAGGRGGDAGLALKHHLESLGITTLEITGADPSSAFPEGSNDKCDALIYDGRDCSQASDLSRLHRFFSPMIRRLNNNGRVIIINEPAESADSAERAAAQRALEGFTRSLAKEIGNRGSTAHLLMIEPGADHATRSTLEYLLSQKSAYIDGQPIRVRANLNIETLEGKPLADKVVIVTGAARGIGESIARVLHREGAKVVGVDIPSASDALKEVMHAIDGAPLEADITADDAPEKIAAKARELGGAHAIVHNAGVTRDKLLVNMPEHWWEMTLEINLGAAQRITREMLQSEALNQNGRVIGVASMVGISGQRGQTNYSASKAGVIGYVDYMAYDETVLQRGITVNAVAPGFIETQMTASIPVLTREIARRLNSLSQGGQSEDVAEAIAWLADPRSAAINGTTLRVCGQNWIGA